ncbi:helix-turn-helix transcriptional regulator [Sapientia aquatica]|uniref:AlpA family phage regulatory protein n=1 Tax=Sapientia aquatica TaxID=1549640 RepID=A0A4R5VRU3_9BURK|nr:AlpA family phage regulatory protein [Sapientia aquatica]TDK61213.1 AlpA family phage regulatory protein [Sapientia aquatica]
MSQRLIRFPELLIRSGLSRSTIYLKIKNGFWTKPVPIGERAVGWPSGEIDALISAQVQEKSKQQIHDLVTTLTYKRKPTE